MHGSQANHENTKERKHENEIASSAESVGGLSVLSIVTVRFLGINRAMNVKYEHGEIGAANHNSIHCPTIPRHLS